MERHQERRFEDIKVSIVMPVYNAAKYLPEAIGDILAQSFTSWELICVNDGSTDGSDKVLQEFANQDTRIHILTQENRGGGAARNVGVAYASGKYVIFLDADDRFERNLLELAVRMSEVEHSEIVVFDGDKFHYESGQRSSAPWLLFGKDKNPDENPFSITSPTVWNKLFLRSFLEKNSIYHQEERVTAFSLYFTAVALLYTEHVSRLEQVLIHYRTDNPASSLSKHDRQPMDTLNILKAIQKKLMNDGKYANKKQIFLNFALKEIMNRLEMFRFYEGYKTLYDALRQWGFRELDLIGNDELLENTYLCTQKNLMLQMPLEEYMYRKEQQFQTNGFLQRTNYLLPQDMVESSDGYTQNRILLYGAGVVGKCFFSQLMNGNTYQIVGWVDKNYKKYGYPVQSPDIINDMVFDCLLIAMEEDETAYKIKEVLIDMGVAEDKIFWEPPQRVV